MPALITDKFRVYNAKQFLESFDENGAGADSTKHFFFVGRSKSWLTLVEYYNLATGTPTEGDTFTVAGVAGTGVVESVFEGGFLASGFDPSSSSVAGVFGVAITSAGWTANVVKFRPASEDEPLRPLDNLEEKYRYYREMIALKRIYDTTDGDGGTVPGNPTDPSFVNSVIQRFDYGVGVGGGTRGPYDMWRHNYSTTTNFTRTADTGASAVSNLENIVRTNKFEVFMCIDNDYGNPAAGGHSAAAGAQNPDPSVIPRTPAADPAVAIAATADQAGWHAESGTYINVANGYRWKYLYTLSTTQVLRFQSQKFIPVSTFDVAGEAVAVVGPMTVSVLDAGSGWGDGDYFLPINGDGQIDANNHKICKITCLGGVIKSARVLDPSEVGSVVATEYTYATVSLVAGVIPGADQGNAYGVFNTNTAGVLSSPATVPATPGSLEVVVPPQGGYGSTDGEVFAEQLNSKRVMCNIRLTFDEGDGDFPVTNDFRRIGLLRDPVAYDTLATITDTTVRNTYAVKFNTGTDVASNFIPDSEIEQVITVGADTVVAKATVVEWLPYGDGSTTTQGGYLRYYQDPVLHRDNGKVYQFVDSGSGGAAITSVPPGASSPVTHIAPDFGPGSTAFSNAVIGSPVPADYPATGQANDLYPEVEPNTGEMIYVENRRLITRAADQIEDIKLVIEF